jgi:hypothetical protein
MEAMTFFRRRPRGQLDLGHYTAPAAEPAVPVQRVVDEGLLVALSGVRLAVKNRMIVAALRDGLDYDYADYAAFATERIVEVADHEQDAAAQLRRRIDLAALPLDDVDRVEYERRALIRSELALALRAVTHDEAALGAILEASRHAALDDIATTLGQRAVEPSTATEERYLPGPDYEAEKDDRVAALIVLDLALLAVERGTSLDQISG